MEAVETRRKEGRMSFSKNVASHIVYDAKQQAQSEYFRDINTNNEARLKNMLVCRHLGLFFQVHPGINPCLINFIFEFFAPLHFVCLLLLQCGHYHDEFNLL